MIAIIPARKGSIRLPKKNRKKLLGKPLINWKVDFAKKLKFINDIVVSTDDKIILEKILAKKKNIRKFLRPKKFSKNNTDLTKAVIQIIDEYEKKIAKVDSILLLQPTSPIRSVKQITRGYRQFKKSKSKNSVVSVSENYSKYKNSFEIKKNYLCKLKKKQKKAFEINGNFFIASKAFLKKNKSFYCKSKTHPVILHSKKFTCDVDTIHDFNKVKKYLLLK